MTYHLCSCFLSRPSFEPKYSERWAALVSFLKGNRNAFLVMTGKVQGLHFAESQKLLHFLRDFYMSIDIQFHRTFNIPLSLVVSCNTFCAGFTFLCADAGVVRMIAIVLISEEDQGNIFFLDTDFHVCSWGRRAATVAGLLAALAFAAVIVRSLCPAPEVAHSHCPL